MARIPKINGTLYSMQGACYDRKTAMLGMFGKERGKSFGKVSP